MSDLGHIDGLSAAPLTANLNNVLNGKGAIPADYTTITTPSGDFQVIGGTVYDPNGVPVLSPTLDVIANQSAGASYLNSLLGQSSWICDTLGIGCGDGSGTTGMSAQTSQMLVWGAVAFLAVMVMSGGSGGRRR